MVADQMLKNTEQIAYKILVQSLNCRNSSLYNPSPPWYLCMLSWTRNMVSGVVLIVRQRRVALGHAGGLRHVIIPSTKSKTGMGDPPLQAPVP